MNLNPVIYEQAHFTVGNVQIAIEHVMFQNFLYYLGFKNLWSRLVNFEKYWN